MQRDGVAVPVRIDGLAGEWLGHRDALESRFAGRSTMLGPFDRLIHDRERTQRMFGFRSRLEVHVPRAKHESG